MQFDQTVMKWQCGHCLQISGNKCQSSEGTALLAMWQLTTIVDDKHRGNPYSSVNLFMLDATGKALICDSRHPKAKTCHG